MLDSLSLPGRPTSAAPVSKVLYGGLGIVPSASDRKFIRASDFCQMASDVLSCGAMEARTVVASEAVLRMIDRFLVECSNKLHDFVDQTRWGQCCELNSGYLTPKSPTLVRPDLYTVNLFPSRIPSPKSQS